METAQRITVEDLCLSEHLERALSAEIKINTPNGAAIYSPIALAKSALMYGEQCSTGFSNSLAYQFQDPDFEQPLRVKTVATQEGLFWAPRLVHFNVGSLSRELEIAREFSRNRKRLTAEVIRFGGQEYPMRCDGHESKVRMELQAFLRELPGVVPLGQ